MTYNVFGGTFNFIQLYLLTVICVLRQLTAVEQQMRLKDGKISELQEVRVAAVCFSVLYKILTAKMREVFAVRCWVCIELTGILHTSLHYITLQ